VRFPPAGVPLPTISPAEESHEHFGEFEWVALSHEGAESPPLIVLRSRKRPEALSLPLLDVWPGSLQRLFPVGGGPDAFLSVVRMAKLARKSQSDPQGALQEAQSLAEKYVVLAQAPRLNAWFYPLLLAEGGENVLVDLETEFDLIFGSLEEAFASPEFQARMSEEVPVLRCAGAIGLFAALLLENLRARVWFRNCVRCGRFLEGGRGDKRFCSRSDSQTCFRRRRAEAKRRERGGHRKGRTTGGS
jgi:hypothetical protein